MNGKWFFPYDYKELIEIGTATKIDYLKPGDKNYNRRIISSKCFFRST
jgi:hypothetical protein